MLRDPEDNQNEWSEIIPEEEVPIVGTHVSMLSDPAIYPNNSFTRLSIRTKCNSHQPTGSG